MDFLAEIKDSEMPDCVIKPINDPVQKKTFINNALL
jgi:hypothetical protein